MKVVGITGGIACGKSHILNKVKAMGAYVIDCDDIVRQLSMVSKPLYIAIIKEFGDEFLRKDLTIDKKKLRNFVFSDENNLKRLNNISKDIIMDELKEHIRCAGNFDIVFVEGVRLFEEGFDDIFDERWFISCNEVEQIRRIMQRDNVYYNQAFDVVSRQRDLLKYKNIADAVIKTDCDLSQVFLQVDELYKRLENGKK